MTDEPPEPKRRRGRPKGGGRTRLQKTLAEERRKAAPTIPALKQNEYPKNTGRLIPEHARRVDYARWRAYTDEVRDFLVAVMRDGSKETRDRIRAAEEILRRGWGQAPTVDVIEATLRVTHEVDVTALRRMSQTELDALALAFTKLVQLPGDDARVIEHEP